MEKAPAPDLIFYDPFSSKTDKALWTASAFLQVIRCCQSKDVELFTYSTSTAVRAAMLSAGFFVGAGVGTGPKTETTRAYKARKPNEAWNLLSKEWLQRWNRSDAKYPFGLGPDKKGEFERQILGHPQFIFEDRI